MLGESVVNMEKQIASLPKIELHRHLEGCITPDYLLQHLQEYNPSHPLTHADKVEELYQYDDFMGFLNAWGTVMDLLTSEEHFRGLAQEVVRQLEAENVIYAELIFSPEPFDNMGLDTELILEILHDEFVKAKTKTKVIIDFVRNFGDKSMANYLTKLIQIRKNNGELKHWIRAVSIGGDEVNYPAPIFTQNFRWARDHGFHLYAHAGEWVGAISIWDAVELLGAERIGHGINAIYDRSLINYLKANRIGLDISITSNYLTGAVEPHEVHPTKQLYKTGCPITINTDDPGFFHTDLNTEYSKFIDLGFTIDDLRQIQPLAIESSFLDEDEREKLRTML
jgi:adenosine deaminase